MESEENLMSEQIKCREVVKARVEGLEGELKLLKASDHQKHNQIKDRTDRVHQLETELSVEKDVQQKLRSELLDMQKQFRLKEEEGAKERDLFVEQ